MSGPLAPVLVCARGLTKTYGSGTLATPVLRRRCCTASTSRFAAAN
jgi:hypothetical protein